MPRYALLRATAVGCRRLLATPQEVRARGGRRRGRWGAPQGGARVKSRFDYPILLCLLRNSLEFHGYGW
jgi:hypothetical protein